MPDPLSVVFEREFFSIDALQRAAYRLSDRMSCDFHAEATHYVCVIHPASAADDPASLAAEFRNEALDYVLRERIREETREIRHVILALAFTDTELVE
jgi:His-Xaa-Ser system protein HxsD